MERKKRKGEGGLTYLALGSHLRAEPWVVQPTLPNEFSVFHAGSPLLATPFKSEVSLNLCLSML